MFVAVAASGTNRVMTSPDGITWTGRTAAEANSWYDVCYGNGLFVAVSYDGVNQVMTSSDGITWTARAEAAALTWYGVCYGNGLFVAVAASGTNNRVMTSPDGITWTSRTSAVDNSWHSVCYGGGLFVAVAFSGTGNRVMTSPDGITWTVRTSAADYSWYGVTYNNGLFVAVAGSFPGTSNKVMTSPDGITWTLRTATGDLDYIKVRHGNGLFIAVARSGTNRVMTSSDGITWTARADAADNSWFGLCYSQGLFVAVAHSGTGNRVMTSPDGITWTSRTSAADNNWYSVAWGESYTEGCLDTIKAYWPLGDSYDANMFTDTSGNENHLTPYLRINECNVEFRIGTRTPDGALGLDYGIIQQVYGSLKGWGKWNRILTATEKTALYGKEYWPFSTTTSLQDAQAYYLLTEAGGSTTYTDSTGNGNNLTASGTTTQVTGPTGSDYATRLCTSADRAKFTASISGTVLTVTVVNYGTIQVGMTLAGNAVLSSTVITSFGTGSGGTGTYNLSKSQTLSSGSMIGTQLRYLAKTNPGVGLRSSQNAMTIAGWVSMNEKPVTESPPVSQMQQVFWGQLIQSTDSAISGFNVYYDPTADRFCFDLDAGDNTILAQGSFIVDTVFTTINLNTWYFVLCEFDIINNKSTIAVNNGTATELQKIIQPLPVAGKIGSLNGSEFQLNPSGSFVTRTSGWDAGSVNGNCHLWRATEADIAFGNNSKTVWGWIKTTTPSTYQTLVGFYDSTLGYVAGNIDWIVQISSNKLYFVFGKEGVSVNVPLSDTSWHFFVAWFNKSTWTIHLVIDNGTIQHGSASTTPQTSTLDFLIGSDHNSTIFGHQFQGVLDGWGIANGVPSQANLNTLWNSGNGVDFFTGSYWNWWDRQRKRIRIGGRR